MKKYFSFILLGLLLAGLGAYVYLVEVRGSEEKKAVEEKALLLFQADPGSVAKLRLQYKDEDLTLFREPDKTWFFSGDLKVPASSEEVNRLISRVFELKEVVEIGKKRNLEDFGLRPSRVALTFWSGTGELINTIHFGDKNPAHDNAYVLTEADSVIRLVTAGVLYSVEKTGFDLRDRDICPYSREELTELTISIAGHRSFTLAKQKDGSWELTGPVAARAKRKEVVKIVDRLMFNKAERIVEEDPAGLAAYGLSRPRFKVAMRDAHGGETVLRIGKKSGEKGNYLARREDRKAVIAISGYVVENINRDYTDLRDTVLVAFRKDKVTCVRLENGGVTRKYTKGPDRVWQQQTPEVKTGPDVDNRVSELVEALNGLTRRAIVHDRPRRIAPYGLDQPVKITLLRENGDPITVFFGSASGKPDGSYYCRIASSPSVYLVSAEVMEKAGKLE